MGVSNYIFQVKKTIDVFEHLLYFKYVHFCFSDGLYNSKTMRVEIAYTTYPHRCKRNVRNVYRTVVSDDKICELCARASICIFKWRPDSVSRVRVDCYRY